MEIIPLRTERKVQAKKGQQTLRPHSARVVRARHNLFVLIFGREKFYTLHTGEQPMAKVEPWYSSGKSDRGVYHYNDQCTEGKQIEAQDRKSGTGNRKSCKQCMQLTGLPYPE